MKRPSDSTLRMLSRLGCLAFSLIALAWIFRKVDLQSLGQVLGRANAGWLAAAWAVFGLALLAAAARWHLVLRLCQCQVHAAATVRTVFIGHLFNTILFGPTGGDVAKTALYVRRYKFTTATILATCVLDRFLGGAGFFVFASSMPGFAAYGGHWWDRLMVAVTATSFAVVIGSAALVTFAAYFFRRRFNWWPNVGKVSRAFMSNGTALLRNPRMAAKGLVFSVISHICVSCVFLFSLEAVTDTPFSFTAVFWIFPVISLITSAPVTFAGAGLREGAALFFLSMYGIPATDAVAASLLVLVTYLIWAVVGGVLFWRDEARGGDDPHALPETLSVVIPTLNEAEALPETVSHARKAAEVIEIIVVDGGSEDDTLRVAQQLGCRVYRTQRGRGGQLAMGARQARGDVVVLLHADTWIPPGAGKAVLNCLRDSRISGGGFWKIFREKSILMIGSRFRCGLRLGLFGRVMGDQVMFVRREALEAIGGVPNVPLMEDFDLCRRLRKHGSLALASAMVTTSSRRFIKLGVARTYWRMWHVTARYYLGAPAEKLQAIYERD